MGKCKQKAERHKKNLPLFYDAEFVVIRESSEESTVGVVSAEVFKEKLLNERHFLKALKRAVTKWIRTYKEGALQWKSSCEDFNLGDLSQQDTSSVSDLGRELTKVGIFKLRVEVHSCDNACRVWTYDTVLFERR